MGAFKVLVVGSGPAGSLLGNGLLNNDVDFEIYERDARDTKRDGYQIRLGENALVGMRACLSKDRLDAVVGLFGRSSEMGSEAPVIYGSDFDKVLDLNQLPAYSRSAAVDRAVLRSALVEPLEAAGKVHYGKKFLNYECVQDGDSQRIRAIFEDGSDDICDLLIGADGNRSKVNHVLGLRNIKELKGYTIVLTKCDFPLSFYRKLSHDVLEAPILSMHRRKSFYFCAYVPRKFLVARDTTEYHQLDDESCSCTLGLVWDSDQSPGFESSSLDEKWATVSRLFKDWSPQHKEVIQLCHGQSLFVVTPRVGSQPHKGWRKGVRRDEDARLGNPQVWLIGDAIHPMLPNRGMGANQAMRDTADSLPQILELAKEARSDGKLSIAAYSDACRAYEELMIPRAFEWVRKSGGEEVFIFDSSKFFYRLLLWLASKGVLVLRLGYWVLLRLTNIKPKHDAPELR